MAGWNHKVEENSQRLILTLFTLLVNSWPSGSKTVETRRRWCRKREACRHSTSMMRCVGGADEKRMSLLINVKAAQQDASAQGQQPPLSHTRLCLSNSAWWETHPLHTSIFLQMGRDDKKHSWKGQMEACLDMFKPTIRLLDGRCLEVRRLVFPGGVCTFCLFFTYTLLIYATLLGLDGLPFRLL